MNTQFNALTIAGSDPSGGAGIQADLKTFQALDCYGMSVITALTAQNTQTVKSVFAVSPAFVEDQLYAVLEDIQVDSVKIGMLFSKEIVEVIARVLKKFQIKNIVLDPVMIAKSGHSLLKNDAVEALKEFLFPFATLMTPNIPEAEILASVSINSDEDRLKAAEIIKKNCHAVLIKGGHSNTTAIVSDLFVSQNEDAQWLSYPRIHTKNTHGTGCTYSAAISAYLAHGLPIYKAIVAARIYLQGAIESGATLNIGNGFGPVDHSWKIYPSKMKLGIKRE